MATAEHVRIAMLGSKVLFEWRQLHASVQLDLSGADLSQIGQGAFVFPAPTTLAQADLSGADLTSANLSGTILTGADLRSSILRQADLSGADLSGADLTGLPWGTSKAALRAESRCSADLAGANLSGANLSDALLWRTRMIGCKVDRHTKLQNAKLNDCVMSRGTRDALILYGSLQPEQVAQITLVDDLARLRQTFSGFYMWTHLLALISFAFPYVYFMALRYGQARFLGNDTEGITLLEALVNYIKTGGHDWKSGSPIHWLALATFGVACSYNLARGILLWKTKALELQHEATGRYPEFHIEGWIQVVHAVARWGFFLYLLVVAAHTVHFLQMRIPV